MQCGEEGFAIHGMLTIILIGLAQPFKNRLYNARRTLTVTDYTKGGLSCTYYYTIFILIIAAYVVTATWHEYGESPILALEPFTCSCSIQVHVLTR